MSKKKKRTPKDQALNIQVHSFVEWVLKGKNKYGDSYTIKNNKTCVRHLKTLLTPSDCLWIYTHDYQLSTTNLNYMTSIDDIREFITKEYLDKIMSFQLDEVNFYTALCKINQINNPNEKKRVKN